LPLISLALNSNGIANNVAKVITAEIDEIVFFIFLSYIEKTNLKINSKYLQIVD
jgi:hypothetical protein